MGIPHLHVSLFVDEHLADLQISIEGCKMNGRKLFLKRLLVHPSLNYISVVVFVHLLYPVLGDLEKPPEYHRLVLHGSLVQQGDPVIIVNLPNFDAFRHLFDRLFQLFDIILLLLQSLLLERAELDPS